MGTLVTGLTSKEGEEIIFSNPVSIALHPKINEWLTLVEKEMRVTLANLLASAVQGVGSFKSGTVDSEYLNWVDQYQAQLVVLASQISWSEGVDAALHAIANGGKDDMTPLNNVLDTVQSTLNVLADSV